MLSASTQQVSPSTPMMKALAGNLSVALRQALARAVAVQMKPRCMDGCLITCLSHHCEHVTEPVIVGYHLGSLLL